MPRVTTNGRVTIPKEFRDELDIEPGDDLTFERTAVGLAIRKAAPTTGDGDDPFETYRGAAGGAGTLTERMGRLRGEYPRNVDAAPGQTAGPGGTPDRSASDGEAGEGSTRGNDGESADST